MSATPQIPLPVLSYQARRHTFRYSRLRLGALLLVIAGASGLLSNLMQFLFPITGINYLVRVAFLLSISLLYAAIVLIGVWLLAGVIPGVMGKMTTGGKIAVLLAACSLGTTMIYLLANLLYFRIYAPGVLPVSTLIIRDAAIAFSLISATLKGALLLMLFPFMHHIYNEKGRSPLTHLATVLLIISVILFAGTYVVSGIQSVLTLTGGASLPAQLRIIVGICATVLSVISLIYWSLVTIDAHRTSIRPNPQLQTDLNSLPT